MKEGIWKKEVEKNASAKDLGPCYRVERRVHTKKRKDILIVERRKGRSTSIYRGSVEERIYPTFQVIPNVTSTLCGKKGWYIKNGTGLLTYKSVDNKEWIFLIPHCQHTGWSREEEGVYEARPKIEIQ